MAVVYSRSQLQEVIEPRALIAAMERAFLAYSAGEAVVPPVGELIFADPPGDCHIKYGYLKPQGTFTVKIATGFWRNQERGLPTSSGIVLVFSALTGELKTIFQDEGYLTDLRTAAAGAVAAKYLAPEKLECIGMVGSGAQARLQLDYLREVTACRRVKVWARSAARAHALSVRGFEIEVADSVRELAASCRLIVTTTAAHHFLVGAADVQPGTHITALGADGGGKQELEPELFARARLRVVDSISQCAAFGDASYAIAQGLIRREDLIELGQLIKDPTLGRTDAKDISIADLTGVAVQDIAIAALALDRLEGGAGT